MQLQDILQVELGIRVTYLSMISLMASADGQLDDEELDFLNLKFEAFEIPEEHRAEIMKVERLDQGALQHNFRELVKEQLHYSFLLDLIIMAVADGHIQNREREMLQKIKQYIGIPSSDYHNLINFAQASAGKDDIEKIDPNQLNVLEQFYRWAGECSIPLYEQTGFALNPAVDRDLKELYHELTSTDEDEDSDLL